MHADLIKILNLTGVKSLSVAPVWDLLKNKSYGQKWSITPPPESALHLGEVEASTWQPVKENLLTSIPFSMRRGGANAALHATLNMLPSKTSINTFSEFWHRLCTEVSVSWHRHVEIKHERFVDSSELRCRTAALTSEKQKRRCFITDLQKPNTLLRTSVMINQSEPRHDQAGSALLHRDASCRERHIWILW